MINPSSAIRPERLRRLLKRLIDIYSPSGKEEEAVDFLYAHLRRLGLPAAKQRVDERRHNLILAPEDGEVTLALVGHVDTVSAYDLEDFGFNQQGDLIRGLGASDMKGAVAAMVEAFVCLFEQKPSSWPVALALVVGEEEDGDGAERLVEDFHAPWAIIGEPSDLKPCLSHYGYLETQITTQAQRLHASLANQGSNPVKQMLELLLQISSHLESRRPELVLNIRDLISPEAGFVVPDRCEAWLDIHLPPTAPVSEIVMEIEDLLAEAQRQNSQLDASLRFVTVHPGYELPAKGLVVEALKSALAELNHPWQLQAFPSHSDANLLFASGVKPIILGCGRLDEAHAPDESVSLAQVEAAAAIYLAVLSRLCQT